MYYFAYGSNMNLTHMRRLCGWNFKVLGAAELQDFEFGVDLRGYYNVREKKAGRVWGVLFEINEAALAALDDFEGYPSVFNRREAETLSVEGAKFTAWVYLESAEQFGGKHLRPDYSRRVLIGARENGLPKQWIGHLEKLGEL